MLIIHLDSNILHPWISRKLVYTLSLTILLVGCAGPFGGFKLDQEFLKERQVQIRKFDTQDEKALLSASAAVLQDMGFTLEESETKLGVISASKSRSAVEPWQVGVKIFYMLLLTNIPIDSVQNISVSLVTSKSSSGGFLLRATFQRVVINDQQREVRWETILEEELYKGFFNKVSQAVFLKAQEI